MYQRTNGEGVVQSASACWLSVEGFQNWEGKCFCLTATFNETGKPDQMELYHLFMTEKKQSEIREEYLDLIQYQKDFPPLNNEKSNPKIREIWPDGSYIESKNLTSVVIRHPKWDGQNVPCRVFVFLTPTKK